MGITVLRTNMYLYSLAELQDVKKCLEISTAFWHRFYSRIGFMFRREPQRIVRWKLARPLAQI